MNKQQALKPLADILKIPSVSTQDKHKPDMKKTREFLVKEFKSMGFETKILKGVKHDAVFASLTTNYKLPTVLIYGHYDVQPPEPLEEWNAPPFKPVIKGDKLFDRGSADNKGQFMIHIMAVKNLLERYEKLNSGHPGGEIHSKNKNRDFSRRVDKLPINFKFLIEGEEEVGSPSIEGLAKKFAKDLFKCDYLLVSDTGMPEKGQPEINISLRGLLYTEISIQTAKQDLHSGTWGGIADNPAVVLAKIISKLKNEDGSINIPGFYKDVLKPSKKLLSDFKQFQKSESTLIKDGKLFGTAGENKISFVERKYSRPTLDVNGIWSGYTEKGAKTVIPSWASAKISMRLVPNQDPDKIFNLFEKRVKELTPKHAKLRIKRFTDCLPYIAPTDDPVFSLMKQSLKKIYKKEPVYSGCGGSIGFVPTMAKALGVPVLMVGFELPGSNIHAPNENFSLSNYYKGIKVFEDFYQRLLSINPSRT